jgi:hypothetical protein
LQFHKAFNNPDGDGKFNKMTSKRSDQVRVEPQHFLFPKKCAEVLREVEKKRAYNNIHAHVLLEASSGFATGTRISHHKMIEIKAMQSRWLSLSKITLFYDYDLIEYFVK